MSIAKHRFKNLPSHLTCSLCDGVLVEPRQCPKGHFFCLTCITNWISNNPSCRDCFVGDNDLTMDQFSKVPAYIITMINDLEVTCDNDEYGCREIVKLSQLADHLRLCPVSKLVDENINLKRKLREIDTPAKRARFDNSEKIFTENNVLRNKITRMEADHANNQAKWANDNSFLKADLLRVRKHRDELAAQNASLVNKDAMYNNPVLETPAMSPQFSPSSSFGSFQDMPTVDLNRPSQSPSVNSVSVLEPKLTNSTGPIWELLMELKSQKIIDQQLMDTIIMVDYDKFSKTSNSTEKISTLSKLTVSISNMVENIKRDCRVLLRIECAFTSVVLANYFPFCHFVVFNANFVQIKTTIKERGFEQLVTSKPIIVVGSLRAAEGMFDVLVHKYHPKVSEDIVLKLKAKARI